MTTYVLTKLAKERAPMATHQAFLDIGWTNKLLIEEGFLMAMTIGNEMKLTLSADDTPEGYESEAVFIDVGQNVDYISDLTGDVIHHPSNCPPLGKKAIVLTPKAWRADLGEDYFVVDTYGEVSRRIEDGSPTIDSLYEIGNYHRTSEDAEPIAVAFKKLLKGEK